MRPLILLLIASLVLPVTTAGMVAWAAYRAAIDGAMARSVEMAKVLREHALRTFEAQSIAIDWIDTRLDRLGWDDVQSSEDIHVLLKRIVEKSPTSTAFG